MNQSTNMKKILCITPLKHLKEPYEYLKSFGEITYKPKISKDDLLNMDMSEYNIIFCCPNGQPYILNKDTLNEFGGTILTASTGLNHIDLDYCMNNNIEVLSHTKDHNQLLNHLPSTAELAFGLMLSIMRNIPRGFDDVKKGGWDYEKFIGHQLKGKTIGIIGYGRLGRMMKTYCHAFGMDVMIYDPYEGYDYLDLLIKHSDIISLHVHVTDETRYMIDKKFLDSIRKGSYIINTSRGEIVNEADVIQSLRDGHLKGYATDVFEDEFGDRSSSPILKGVEEGLNIIVTPHVGGSTWEGQQKAYMWSIKKLEKLK